jgi:hypothetical protein
VDLGDSCRFELKIAELQSEIKQLKESHDKLKVKFAAKEQSVKGHHKTEVEALVSANLCVS